MLKRKTHRFCIQCGNVIETSFETKFCSLKCWEIYKSEHGLSVAVERKATVFIKTKDNMMEHFPISEKNWKSLATAKSIMLVKDDDRAEALREIESEKANVESIDLSSINQKTVILNKNMFSTFPNQEELHIEKVIQTSEDMKAELELKNRELVALRKENSRLKSLAVKMKEKNLVIRELKRELRVLKKVLQEKNNQ